MSNRQPVIIMQRGHRVDVPYSVFPLYHKPGDRGPSIEGAMFHGSQAECEAWIDARADHVVLYGLTCEGSDWLEQQSRYADQVRGRPLPERCTWRPPEEREQALREWTANELDTRLQAVEALHALLVLVDQSIASVGVLGSTCDEGRLTAAYRDARNAVGRHTDAHQRLAKLTKASDADG